MALLDDVALVLRGQNLATPAIVEVTRSMRLLRDETILTRDSFKALNVEMGASLNVTRSMIGPQNDLRYVMEATTRAIADQGIALRTTAAAAAGSSYGSVVGTGQQAAIRATAADSSAFLRAGSTRIGPANFAGSALGIPVPVLAAAVVGYLGYKAVGSANAYNQSIADIVSQSTQNAGSIPGLQSGVLGLAGGQNRFTPQQLVQGLYPIASSPIFANQADQIAALRVVSQQAQGSGANSIKSLSSADVGAVSAYGFTPRQMQFVADTIQKGVNIGLAESPDFAKGVGTFSAASLAADPNRVRAFQQAIGAFAQQTNLSPRFRFDAQGENAFFQVINKSLTGKSGALAGALGISDLFGPGAEGRAGGLQSWLSQLQTATAGPNQQGFLQGLFGRQNALQFVRGFTGSNYASGQIAICGTADAAGTVLKGANIADRGPQAQWDQINSRFQKDVIEVGTVINTALTPGLVKLASQAMTAAQALGDAAHWVATHLPQVTTPVDAGNPTVPRDRNGNPITGGPGMPMGAMTPAGIAQWAANNLPGLLFGGTTTIDHPSAATPGFIAGIVNRMNNAGTRASGDGGFLASLHLIPPAQQQTVAADFMGPLAPGEVRIPGDTTRYGGSGAMYASTQQAIIAGRVAANQAAAYRLLTAQHGNNNALLTADRGSINYQIGVGASNSVLNQALAKLQADLGHSSMDATGQRNYLQKFGTGPVDRVENQRLVDAAQLQYNAASTFEQSVRIHREGLSASNAAAQQVYAASMNLINVEVKAGTLKRTDAATLRLGAQDTLNQSLLANLQPAMQEAQAALSLAQLTGKGVPGARAAEAALLKQQAALGGIGPNQLALDLYQLNAQAGRTALPTITPAQLIRPLTAGAGHLVEAGFGMSNAALAGGPTSHQNDLVNQLRQQVAYLQQEVTTLRSIDNKMSGVVANTSHTATHTGRAAHTATHPAHHARANPFAHIRRHH